MTKILYLVCALLIPLGLTTLIKEYKDRYVSSISTEERSKPIDVQGRRVRLWGRTITFILCLTFLIFDASIRPFVAIASGASIVAGLWIAFFWQSFEYSPGIRNRIPDFQQYHKQNQTFMSRLAGCLIIWGGLTMVVILFMRP